MEQLKDTPYKLQRDLKRSINTHKWNIVTKGRWIKLREIYDNLMHGFSYNYFLRDNPSMSNLQRTMIDEAHTSSATQSWSCA